MCLKKNCKPPSPSEYWHSNPYSLDNLINELSLEESFRENIRRKPHVAYFSKYLDNIGAKCYVVEKEYVDKDYLEDYSLYYARCFKKYERFCKRIHFFSKDYDNTTLEKIFFETGVSEADITEFQNSYLGFIVVKPLPLTVIGRTCLKAYIPKTEGELFYIYCPIRANLFGIELSVETIPFQEQDKVVSACATSALWSAFQKTGELFDHKILSPSKITQYAVENRISKSRPFPNTSGLTPEQMAHAIFKVELEPLCINIEPVRESKDLLPEKGESEELFLARKRKSEELFLAKKRESKELFLANLYAYTKLSIPVLFIVKIFDELKGIFVLHAISIAGFNITNGKVVGTKLPLVSDRINKLYGHDDQFGPYTTIEYDTEQDMWYSLWETQDHKKKELSPHLLLIPIYHKIRITFETIWSQINSFHKVLLNHKDQLLLDSENIFKAYQFDEIEWDIYLISNNDLKKQIRQDATIDTELRKELLSSVFPKYLWSATILSKRKPLTTFLFDATDIDQGLSVLTKIPYDVDFDDFAKSIVKNTKNLVSIVWRSYMPDNAQKRTIKDMT